jgi:signal transduction histidine kinase
MYKLPLTVKIRSRRRFVLFMVIAAVLCSISAFYFVRYLVKPYTGLVAYDPEVKSENGELIFSPRLPDSPALRAGLVPGKDRLLALNSIPLSNIRSIIAWESEYYLFEPIAVTVSDEMGSIRTVTIVPELSVTRIDWLFLVFFLVILGGTALYILIHYFNEIAHVLFAMFALCFMAYTSVLPFCYENTVTVFFVNFGELTAWLTIIFLAFFQRDIFPAILKKALVMGVLFIAVVTFVLRFYFYLSWMITGSDQFYFSLQSVGRIQNEYDFVAYLLFLVLIIIIYLKTRQKELKHHIEWITAGAMLALPPHFFFNQLPVILGNTQNYPLIIGNASHIFLSFLPLAYIIGLVRSRGYKLKVLQTRSIIYIFVAFFLLALFTITYQPVQVLFTGILKLGPEISGFIIAISLFILALYLQFLIFLFIDNRLIKEKQYDTIFKDAALLKEIQSNAADVLRALKKADLEILLEGITGRIGTFLEEIRKNYVETKKHLLNEHKIEKRSSPQAPAEHGKTRFENEKRFEKINKNALSLEQFLKKFEIVTKSRTAIRISLAIDTLIKNVISQSRRKWANIDIEYGFHPAIRVLCSPEEITFCLLFIIENAYESLSLKTDKILITARPHLEFVTIEVTDCGNGILLKNIGQVGQPFFTTKQDHDGLSLYFAKIILERNNGLFSIEPGTEMGTKVYIHLPNAKAVGPIVEEQNP